MNIFQSLPVLLVGAVMALPASATVLYSNQLQTPDDFSSWLSTKGDAVISTAPDGSDGLTFTGVTSHGDVYANGGHPFSSDTGSFTVSFEIYGNCGQHTSGCGAFLWASGATSSAGGWLLADTIYSGLTSFEVNPGQWEKVTYTFAGNSTDLGFENWMGSTYAAPYSFYIRNLVLTNNSDHTDLGTLSVTPVAAPVPEPATWGLMASGLVLTSVLRRKSHTAAL
jgi:hypothetical protein